MLIPYLLGGGALLYYAAARKPKGVKLAQGDMLTVAVYVTPMPTREYWDQLAKTPAALAAIAANLYPPSSGLSTSNITLAPAVGHFNVILEATENMVYKPRSIEMNGYRFTDESARKL